MLPGMFPRLFSQFKGDTGLIVGQFTVSNSGATLTPTANCYRGLTATGDTGVYTVSLAGGARGIVVVAAHLTSSDLATVRTVTVTSVTASTGAIVLQVVNPATEAVADAIADAVDTSILTVTLLVNK